MVRGVSVICGSVLHFKMTCFDGPSYLRYVGRLQSLEISYGIFFVVVYLVLL